RRWDGGNAYGRSQRSVREREPRSALGHQSYCSGTARVGVQASDGEGCGIERYGFGGRKVEDRENASIGLVDVASQNQAGVARGRLGAGAIEGEEIEW